jgi:hypothetical protein
MLPAMIYGASENRITKVVTVGADDILEAQNAPVMVIDLKDGLEAEDTFYLLLQGAEWAVGSAANEIRGDIQGMPESEEVPTLEVKKITPYELQIRVKSAAISGGASLRIPLHTKVTGAEAYVTLNNNNTTVTAGSYLFAKTMDYRAKITAGDIYTTTGNAVMADIMIEEPYSQAFYKSLLKGKSDKIQLVLNTNDYEFALDRPEIGVPTLTGIKGFDTISGGAEHLRKLDAQTIELTLPDISHQRHTGGFVLSGIVLKTTGRTPQQGMVTVSLSGDLVIGATAAVLEVSDYGIDLVITDKAQIVAGRSKTVAFDLEEKVSQSLVRERLTAFTFSNGAKVKLGETGKVEVLLNGATMAFEPIREKDKPIGFEVPSLPGSAMKYAFELQLDVPSAVTGEIQVTAEGRSLIETLSAQLLEVIPPVHVTMQPMFLKRGLKDQIGGSITITEIIKGEIEQDALLFIKIEKNDVNFSKPPVVEVTTGDLRVGAARLVEGGVEIPIIRRSNTPSVLEIKNFTTTVSQMAAEGTYVAEIGGEALSELATDSDIDPIVKGDFMIISKEGTPPVTEQKVIFTIDHSFYTVGQTVRAMDVAPFIKDGRTMLPIKYVAYALGVDPNNVFWDEKNRKVTIRGNEVIELKIGSKEMKIDGLSKAMLVAPEIHHGRTFVPVAEITRALGITTQWNEQFRTVTLESSEGI